MVKLALTGNMSTGGISVDRTFDAHPDNVEIAEEAARMIGLDVAGIDFICPDIASPVRETGGAICEVNAAPGFRMHTHPTVGEPQFIAKPVVDLLFPPGVPVARADRRRHRHQRQDHDVADDRPHLQGNRPQGRHDVDRRHRHRRAPGLQGRRLRTAVGADGPAEPARRLRGDGGRPRRHPPRGPGLRPQRRRRRHQRRARPPRHEGHRHPRAAGRRQGRRRGSGAAQRFRGAQRRRRPRPQDASPLLRRRSSGSRCSHPAARSASSSRTTAGAADAPSSSTTPSAAT